MTSRPPVSPLAGAAIQDRMATTSAAMAAWSSRPMGAGRMPAPRWLSQLRVKLGTTRPPISADQYEDGAKADPPAQFAGRQAQCSGLRQRAADSEARQQRQDRQVAPASAGHDLAQGEADQDHAEADIDCGRKPRAGRGTNEIEAARRGPEKHQTKQRQTADRRPAGPVRYRGQQETGQHAARIAEQHLMLMPGERIEREREAHHTGEHPQPESQGQRSPERGPKKERAETLPKDGDTR